MRYRAHTAAARPAPLPGEVLLDRDAVHRLRHRDHLSVPVRRREQGTRPVRACRDHPVHRHRVRRLRLCLASRRIGLGLGAMGIEEKLPDGVLLASVEKLVNWTRKSSLWPATFGLACCAIEMMTFGAPRFDSARFGMEVFRASPRQAALMIAAGRLSQKMAPVLRQIYAQMAEPKWVLAMGVCASPGGMFNNYAIVQGVDHVVPVDMYLPGCPPRPEMLLDSILKLHDKIRTGPINGKPEWTTLDETPYEKPILRDTRISKGLPVDAPIGVWQAPVPGEHA